MWPFARKVDPNRIEIHLDFWGDPASPSFTARLLAENQIAVEAVGAIQGSDFRLGNIKTEPAFRKKGYGTTVKIGRAHV